MKTRYGRPPRRGIRAVPVLAFLLTISLALPRAVADDEGKDPPKTLTVSGKLVAHAVEGKAKEFLVAVGDRTWRIAGDAPVVERLTRLRNKYVSARGTPAPTDSRLTMVLTVASPDAIAALERAPVQGTVRTREEEGAKSPVFYLEREDGEVGIDGRDARRFEEFVGIHVEATGYLVADDRSASLEGVRSVERKLLPDERDPKNGEEALRGSWDGTFTALEVPKGVPAETGDYPVTIRTGEDIGKCTGRFLSTYDIVGLRVRKCSMRLRSIEFDLEYDFGTGSSSVRCEATFGPDWKTLSGRWKSGSIGSGTFEIAWKAAKDG